jgi:hypothetical protein
VVFGVKLGDRLTDMTGSLGTTLPATFVRINPAGRFLCALCLQTLELYLNIIEALYYRPEIRRRVDSHDKAGGNTK